MKRTLAVLLLGCSCAHAQLTVSGPGSLNAASLSGTIAASQVTGTAATLGGNNTFTGTNNFSVLQVGGTNIVAGGVISITAPTALFASPVTVTGGTAALGFANTFTANRLLFTSATNNIGFLVLGSGLSITSGTLTAADARISGTGSLAISGSNVIDDAGGTVKIGGSAVSDPVVFDKYGGLTIRSVFNFGYDGGNHWIQGVNTSSGYGFAFLDGGGVKFGDSATGFSGLIVRTDGFAAAPNGLLLGTTVNDTQHLLQVAGGGASFDGEIVQFGNPLTSGTLLVGHTYRISGYADPDDFTNVGAASNANGVIFTATGTTPTEWDNNSVVSEEVLSIVNGETTLGTISWSQVTSRPTTLAGYGITNAQAAIVRVSGTLTSGTATIANAAISGSNCWVQDNASSLTNVGSLTVTTSSTVATIRSTNVIDTSPFTLFIAP